MDNQRFDHVTKLFARRSSRRAAIGVGGIGVVAAVTGVIGPRTAAQDGTPAASPEAEASTEQVSYLFVQIFSSGTFAPKPDEAGVYTVTLSHGTAQTVYFSDRPERIVGSVPTQRFLDGLGFSPENPPNAALVAQTGSGEDVIVVELLNPRMSESFGPDGEVTVSYDVRVLEDYQDDGLRVLADRQQDAELPSTFGSASLFIDDCSDQTVACCQDTSVDQAGTESCVGFAGNIGPVGFCWEFGDVCCHPCESSSYLHWDNRCNAQFPACNGNCKSFLGHSCW